MWYKVEQSSLHFTESFGTRFHKYIILIILLQKMFLKIIMFLFKKKHKAYSNIAKAGKK